MLVVLCQIFNGECEVGVFVSQDISKSYVLCNDGSEDVYEIISLEVLIYKIKQLVMRQQLIFNVKF